MITSIIYKKFFQLGIQSNSTASVRSDTLNLNVCRPHITVDEVIKAVGCHFSKIDNAIFENFEFVNPVEQNFPGNCSNIL